MSLGSGFVWHLGIETEDSLEGPALLLVFVIPGKIILNDPSDWLDPHILTLTHTDVYIKMLRTQKNPRECPLLWRELIIKQMLIGHHGLGTVLGVFLPFLVTPVTPGDSVLLCWFYGRGFSGLAWLSDLSKVIWLNGLFLCSSCLLDWKSLRDEFLLSLAGDT